mmetsp:Transcript_127543/g.369228  ORF Transcript_127543/g.369228 Transcript_127543/m.369228 type:complete len:217 (+) Transcript_127543:137-787(+)
MFSALRFSLARCKSSCCWAICECASAMPSSKVLMSCSKAPIFASKSVLWSVALAVDISVSWNSALHQSFFFTSSACCFFSIATISSIAFFTLVKASSSTFVARMESVGLWAFFAALRINSAACRRLWATFLSEETCMKLKVLDIASRASSPFKIPIASETAWISDKRAFLRSSKFLLASEQVSFKFIMNFWSSERTDFSCSMSSLASARALIAFAS